MNISENGSDCSSDEEDSHQSLNLSEELGNLRSVILLTRENIDALNDKFANLRDPPQMLVFFLLVIFENSVL